MKAAKRAGHSASAAIEIERPSPRVQHPLLLFSHRTDEGLIRIKSLSRGNKGQRLDEGRAKCCYGFISLSGSPRLPRYPNAAFSRFHLWIPTLFSAGSFLSFVVALKGRQMDTPPIFRGAYTKTRRRKVARWASPWP